jgi:hypothetical protein
MFEAIIALTVAVNAVVALIQSLRQGSAERELREIARYTAAAHKRCDKLEGCSEHPGFMSRLP